MQRLEQLQTGPAGTVVGNIPLFTIVDNDDNENDLIGPTRLLLPTTVDAFAGGIRKHWVVNPINNGRLIDADVAA